MAILSPMPTGNGAFIVHKLLSREISGYHVCAYSPYLTLFPPSLFGLCRSSRKGADCIHTVPDYGLFFDSGRIPLVLTLHNFMLDAYMFKYSSVLQKIHYRTDLKWFTRASLARASMITSVSQFTADLARRELGFDGDIRVINNGVDTNVFFPGQDRVLAKGPLKVLFAGNLTRRKGADLLPEIARHVGDNVKILYTGGLRTKKKLPKAPSLQPLGLVLYKDMPDLYRSVDLLLFPTVREGFPLVVAEAMACGLPVVATDCSSLPELVDEGKGGYLCTQGDARGFAQKINLLAESALLRRNMGEYNRSKVEKTLRLETMIQRYRMLFDEVRDSRRKPDVL